jgi:hypothetical protein
LRHRIGSEAAFQLRHGITNREKEFKMASEVIASITSTMQK